MDEQEFEKLLSMAKNQDVDTSRMAWLISESSNLPKTDKTTIKWEHFKTLNESIENEKFRNSIRPFKKR